MLESDMLEYNRTLILPDSVFYAVYDLLKWITISSINCDHPRNPPPRTISKFEQLATNSEICACSPQAQYENTQLCSESDSAGQTTDTSPLRSSGSQAINQSVLASAVRVEVMQHAFESSGRICTQCRTEVTEYKDYLLRRLREDVVLGKFKLWDMSLNRSLAPPPNKEGGDTPTAKESDSELSRPLFRKMRSQPAQALREHSFIRALHKTVRNQHAILSQDRNYKTLLWWATAAYIKQTDLVSFCKEERVRILFEDDIAKIRNETEESTTENARKSEIKPNDIEETSNESAKTSELEQCKGTADYKRLAEIFQVDLNQDRNLKWFKNQCSNNLGRGKLFREALVEKGHPGRKASQFSIILIAAALRDQKNVRPEVKIPGYLRRRIEKFEPDLLDEFDDKLTVADESD